MRRHCCAVLGKSRNLCETEICIKGNKISSPQSSICPVLVNWFGAVIQLAYLGNSVSQNNKKFVCVLQWCFSFLPRYYNIFSECAIQYVYRLYIQRVSKMVVHSSGVSFTHQNRENVVEICGHVHIVFEVQIGNLLTYVVRPSGCCLWGNLETSSVFRCKWGHLETYSVFSSN